MRILLDEAVAQAIQAEAQTQGIGVSKTTMDINRQCAEILKFIAEKLIRQGALGRYRRMRSR